MYVVCLNGTLNLATLNLAQCSWTTLPRPVDREPSTTGLGSTDIRVATYVMSVVGREVADRNLEVMIWSTLCISVA